MERYGTLEVEAAAVDGRAVVTLAGELDISAAGELRGFLDGVVDAGVTEVVVDMSPLEFIDSTGLTVLIGLHKRLRSSGGAMTLRAPQERVFRVMALTGLADAFTIER